MATLGSSDPADLSALSGLAPELASAFVSLASDIALVIGEDGIVTNVAAADAGLALGAGQWVGRPWAETVTGGTRRKIEQLLQEVGSHGVSRRREVNHPSATGEDIPISYAALRLGAGGPLLAVGRDLRAVAAIQQRFVEAQREMERDYWRLRQEQSRQRLLAQVASDAVMVVQLPTLLAADANAQAQALFGAPGQPLPPPIRDLLALAQSAGRATEVRTRLQRAADVLALDVSVVPIRPDDAAQPQALLVRARPAEAPQPGNATPDAVLVADANGRVLMANAELLYLAGADTEAQLAGRPVAEVLGDPHRQLAAALSDARRAGFAAQPRATIGAAGSPVAVALWVSLLADGDQERLAFVLRPLTATAHGSAPPGPPLDLAATLQRIAQRVGQLPLPALLREASDATERHAIETALTGAGGRPSAAALQLGIDTAELQRRMQRLGLASGGTDSTG